MGRTSGWIGLCIACIALTACGDRSGGGSADTEDDTGDPADSADASTTGDPDDELPPEACEGGLGRRQLRLLTRREYEATVHDLFGLDAAQGCESDAACPDGSTCQDSRCLLESTPALGFAFDPQGQLHTSVHVAGSFNDWPGTIGDGGLALSFDDTSGLWTGAINLDAGVYEYKFVLDEATWIADPGNPDAVDDGVGGQNSRVEVTAEITELAPVLGYSAAFPVESRPEGFGFDNSAEAGLVTSVHVEQYMRAAESLSAAALGQRLEVLQDVDFLAAAPRLVEEALELLSAPDCPTGTMDVLLAPDQMILQIHESIGHPLELDRILGDERNYAGTSVRHARHVRELPLRIGSA